MRSLKLIGGSDIATIMGKSPWMTRAQLYDRIIAPPSPLERKQPSLASAAGTHLEDGIAKLWQATSLNHIHGHKVCKVKPRRDAACQHFVASPDRLVFDHDCNVHEGLEIKFTDNHAQPRDELDECRFGRTMTTKYPLRFKMQMAWQARIFDLPRVRLVALITGTPEGNAALRLAEYVYERDKEFEALLFVEATKFLNDHVLAKKRPDEPVQPERQAEVIQDWMKRETDEQ
jgi:predicted phage-related endonuclease